MSVERDTKARLSRRQFLKGSGAAAGLFVGGGYGFLTSCAQGPWNADFDMVIRGGTVCDGVSALMYPADVGIVGERIIAVGELSGMAGKVINAEGLIVAPGFIDVHNHSDLTFERAGWKKNLAYIIPSFKGNYNYVSQGVTTVVTGNCGYGYVDLEYWLDMVNRIGFGTNVLHLIPHGIVREELFGEDQPTTLTKKQKDRLIGRIREIMDMGAVGISTGLEYYPGFLTDTDELVEVSREVAKRGGLYATHMRDESGALDENGVFGVVASIREAAHICREAEIPVQISHLKASAPHNNVAARDILEAIESARSEGLDITADQYPYDAGSTQLTILLPVEMVYQQGIRDEYRTKEKRGEVTRAIGDVFEYLPPEKILISVMYEGEKSWEGKTLQEIAVDVGRDPAQIYTEMVCDMPAPLGIFFIMEMETVRELMTADYVMTSSDGMVIPKGFFKPHPRLYGAFPKKIRRFALDEKIIGLTECIRSMTSLPAEKFNISNRGVIRQGAYADVTIFNPDTIMDTATYQDPHQYADGIEYVLVNGVVAVDGGELTGDRGGRGVRRGDT
ncbi:MAG: amidohydrolase family protein [Deltaproteobacteria bacterium]|nr:amidohydrolase family protein [Candidatus Zymogenaceae bacterium]